jgi:hypothetical protein
MRIKILGKKSSQIGLFFFDLTFLLKKRQYFRKKTNLSKKDGYDNPEIKERKFYALQK